MAQKRYLPRHKVFLAAFLALCLLALSFPLGMKLLFRDMPRPSAAFDCDDAAFFEMHRLSSIGIKSTAIVGNLEIKNAGYSQSNHIWLLADIAGLRIPIDWGHLAFGSKYYQGYALTYPQLVFFVAQDFAVPNTPVNPSAQ